MTTADEDREREARESADKAVRERVREAELHELETMLDAGTLIYGTGALHELLSNAGIARREEKVMMISAHHTRKGVRPGPEEGVGALPDRDTNAEGEAVSDPLLHHAVLSQRVTRPVTEAIAQIVTSAGEDPQQNGRRPGAWGLVATDYLRALPLSADPEPGTLETVIEAMGGWSTVDADATLTSSVTAALLRESCAHGHLKGIERARTHDRTPAWMALIIEMTAHDGALCARFLNEMVAREPRLLVRILEDKEDGGARRKRLATRIASDVREPIHHTGGLHGAQMRDAFERAHRQARHTLGMNALRMERQSINAPGVH